MTAIRTIGIIALGLGLCASSAAAQGDPPAPTAPTPDQEPTIEQRLRVLPINDYAARGALPTPADLELLVKEKDVTGIICLLEDKELPAELREAAQKAGAAFEIHSLGFHPDRPPSEARINRQAVHKVVDLIKGMTAGRTYVHCDTTGNRASVIEFAYRVSVNGWDYAQALRQAVDHGFKPGEMPGLVEDMKLLASGLEELPVIEGIDISSRDLLGPGEPVTVGGVRLNTKTMGEGPPVYIIHGGPGESHTQYRPYLDALADGHMLVYYDQRGCGSSGRPQFAEAYTIDRLVTELEGLRVKLGHERISLVAHSSGGGIALKYALAYPQHVDKLVIVSSWASGEEFVRNSGLVQQLMSPDDVQAYQTIDAKRRKERRMLNDSEIAELAKMSYPANFFGVMSPQFREEWNRRAQVSALAWYALTPEFFVTYDIREQLANLSALPTLVIVGKFDVITPPSIMQTIAGGIKGARYEVFERSGHFPMVEEHDRFIKLVSEFLDSESPAAVEPKESTSS